MAKSRPHLEGHFIKNTNLAMHVIVRNSHARLACRNHLPGGSAPLTHPRLQSVNGIPLSASNQFPTGRGSKSGRQSRKKKTESVPFPEPLKCHCSLKILGRWFCTLTHTLDCSRCTVSHLALRINFLLGEGPKVDDKVEKKQKVSHFRTTQMSLVNQVTAPHTPDEMLHQPSQSRQKGVSAPPHAHPRLQSVHGIPLSASNQFPTGRGSKSGRQSEKKNRKCPISEPLKCRWRAKSRLIPPLMKFGIIQYLTIVR
ncbi:hypothetical protein CEXT_708061 [Caerostris extrusa]|uniref:Uncharacterized protein n=1 Tax=Caerostris extrusa TaxID=172846 RepID=A0AAV4RNJ3_CAEEX|nr:hypothetical protein CEXT_708061 [Caerostris extrusa]